MTRRVVELADCEPIIGDHIERTVLWNGGKDLESFAGQPVRLKFEMVECDLYSLKFSND